MKEYFYESNGKQIGPVKLDELKDIKITKETLVWTEELENWTTADSINELKEIIFTPPPPLPSEIKDPIDNVALLFGIVSLIAIILYRFLNEGFIDGNNTISEGYYFSLVIIFILRIIFASWAYSIANRKTRNNIFWALITFMSPGIGLITISLLNKKVSK